MKKLNLMSVIVLLCILLISCENSFNIILPTNDVTLKYYNVESIEKVDVIHITNDKLCIYNLDCVGTIFYRNISVVDSIGKFKIGDKVYLNLNLK